MGHHWPIGPCVNCLSTIMLERTACHFMVEKAVEFPDNFTTNDVYSSQSYPNPIPMRQDFATTATIIY